MPPKRKKAKVVAAPSDTCVCGANCSSTDAYLPGYLFLVLGVVTVPINLGLIPGLEAGLAWPLVFFVVSAIAFAKVALCRGKN